jgi:galacturonosyltransferase
MSNVVLESAATGRPIITTNRSGCKEIVDHGISGYLIEPKKQNELNNAIENFLNLSIEEKINMGKLGREKVEKEFNREFIVDEYMTLINNILGG